jgi:hypothetical protein
MCHQRKDRPPGRRCWSAVERSRSAAGLLSADNADRLTFSSLVHAKAKKDAIMKGIDGNMALSRICKGVEAGWSEVVPFVARGAS